MQQRSEETHSRLLLAQGHTVRCFDTPTKANERVAKGFANQIDVRWGDIRRTDDVVAAVAGQEVVVHLAFVIPRLSVTGVNSEDRPAPWLGEFEIKKAPQAKYSPGELLGQFIPARWS